MENAGWQVVYSKQLPEAKDSMDIAGEEVLAPGAGNIERFLPIRFRQFVSTTIHFMKHLSN